MNPSVYIPLRRQVPRQQGARYARLRARSLLLDRRRLHGFQTACSPTSVRCLFCHSDKRQPVDTTRPPGSNRSEHGAVPIYTLAEVTLLAEYFPDNIFHVGDSLRMMRRWCAFVHDTLCGQFLVHWFQRGRLRAICARCNVRRRLYRAGGWRWQVRVRFRNQY